MTTFIEITLLARLIETDVIKHSARTAPLIARLATARWIVPSTRQGEWQIRKAARPAIRQRLEKLLPTWETDFLFLRQEGLNPYDPATIKTLPQLQRILPSAPAILNRRNWNAAVGLGPKHRPKRDPEMELTKDWILRFRPNEGLRLKFPQAQSECGKVTPLSTECLLPERTWKQVLALTGTHPRLLITCENLGAYIDLPPCEGVLILYSPGDDTEAALALLTHLPHVPWMHFGDLDPEGLGIGQRLAQLSERPLRFFIPSFAADYLSYGTPPPTPWPHNVPHPFLEQLKNQNKALYQEVFMLDPRLAADLEAS